MTSPGVFSQQETMMSSYSCRALVLFQVMKKVLCEISDVIWWKIVSWPVQVCAKSHSASGLNSAHAPGSTPNLDHPSWCPDMWRLRTVAHQLISPVGRPQWRRHLSGPCRPHTRIAIHHTRRCRALSWRLNKSVNRRHWQRGIDTFKLQMGLCWLIAFLSRWYWPALTLC